MVLAPWAGDALYLKTALSVVTMRFQYTMLEDSCTVSQRRSPLHTALSLVATHFQYARLDVSYTVTREILCLLIGVS